MQKLLSYKRFPDDAVAWAMQRVEVSMLVLSGHMCTSPQFYSTIFYAPISCDTRDTLQGRAR